MGTKAIVAILMSLVLVLAPVASAGAPEVVGKISTKGRAEVNGAAVPGEATVFSGDRISTGKQTATGLSLPGGDQVFLPSESAAQVSRSGGRIRVTLEHGALAVVNRSTQPVVIEAHGAQIEAAGPAGGVYEVALQGNNLKVLARKGTARVTTGDATHEVTEGKTLDATASTPPPGGGGMGPLWTVVLVAGAAAGFTGLALGLAAVSRPEPQDCLVVSPNTIKCP